MNDYYMTMCDLESEEKSGDYYWFDDEWLDYSYDDSDDEDTNSDEEF